MSDCNMLEKAATCPAAACSKRLQLVRLQHARTGGNMSGYNMLEQAVTCPATTCSTRRQHIRLQHARTGGNMSGYNMLEQAATSCCILLQQPFLRSPRWHCYHVDVIVVMDCCTADNAKKIVTLFLDID